MLIRSASYNAYQAISAALLSWGLQTTWVIDPLTGNDAGDGTALAPLKTMAEFNARMSGNLIAVPSTLQLLGDVLDAPLWLRGTSYGAGASLTVSGTVTAIGSATITVVTGLNPAGATLQPWQLTTTGVNWTTVPLGSRISLSNGSVGFIRDVVDANNVVCGAFSTIATASIVPTATLTLTVQSLSRVLPPNITIQAIDSAVAVTVRDVSMDTGSITSINTSTASFNGNFLVFGCEIKTPSGTVFASVGGMQIRGSRLTMPTTANTTIGFRPAAGQIALNSCVFSGATSGFITPNNVGSVGFQHACIAGSRILVQGGALLTLSTSCNIQHSTTAVQVDVGGYLNSGVCKITGSAGTGVGIDVRCGTFIWNGAAAKPSITGATDCAVAGVNYTYAALGTGKTASLLNAIPPTVTPVVNTDPNRGPGIATMSQSG